MVRLWLSVGLALAVAIAAVIIASTGRQQQQPGADPTAIITAYETARSRQDMETALSYFADDASITQRNTTFTGKDQIRKYLGSISARAPYIVVSDRHTTGNIVSWTERTGSPQVGGPTARLPGYTGGQAAQGTPAYTGRPGTGQTGTGQTGPGQTGTGQAGTGQPTTASATPQAGFLVTVEAVVQDGKIESMSYIFGSQVPRPDPALEGRAQLPASVGLAAVLAVLAGVVLVASTGLRRSTRVSSTLHGHLMQDLQGWAAARE
jgi:hypothetical protein